MRLSFALSNAYHGVKAKPSRTALTLLGIAIGIMAVMLIMSMGTGAQRLILNEISGLGAETFVVQPGREPTGVQDITEVLFSDSLKQRDVDAMRRQGNVPHLFDMMPLVAVPGSPSFDGETYRRAQIIGGDAEFFGAAFNFIAGEGSLFGEEEIAQKAFVAVIGSEVKEELFGPSDALNQRITIGGRKFRVSGVLPDKGRVAFLDLNNLIIIPHTTAQTYILGIDHFNEFIVKVDDPANVARSVKDTELTLREVHGLAPGEENDFRIETQQGLLEQIGTIISILTTFLTAVVAISLLVGGIGIMNIMLVSVTERTREIGLRKAVGAREKDILLQFLLESVVLTVTGGVIGIVAGLLITFLTSFIIANTTTLLWEFAVPYSGIALSLGVSTAIGLIFGIYPARQAAKKSPMEALRYE